MKGAKNIMQEIKNIVTVPCFSGAPWNLKQLSHLSDFSLKTMRLPEKLDNIEDYADFVQEEIDDLKNVILVGDSFGAIISLALAIRRPENLKALVISGGFASNPVTNPLLKARINAASFFPGFLYRALTLRLHASSLSSPYDKNGEITWTRKDSRELFAKNTPFKSYINRAKAALSADYLDKLKLINVPVLIITPSYDKLIGEKAAKQMLERISDVKETVMENSGHMLRFTHPGRYSQIIKKFLIDKGI
jgi:pimeloyl-ACP methyl ester carboxylesterase